jgi:hypothetical protein
MLTNPNLLAVAVEAMLPLLEEERRSLVESYSELTTVRGKIRVVPGTLDPDVAEHVAAYDHAIDLAYKALGIG